MTKLKEYRINKNLTMKEMAILLDIPYTTYNSYENGYKKPSIEKLILISEKLNMSIDYLLEINCSRYKVPTKIVSKTDAIQFLTYFRMIQFVDSNDEQKVITFAGIFHSLITNFIW